MTSDMPPIEPAPFPGGDAFLDLPARLAKAAEARPDQVAVIDGEDRITWARLLEQVRGIAGTLLARGLGKGAVVASVAGNSHDHLAAYLGTLWAGAAMAPLPAGATAEALAAMLTNSDAGLVLADAKGRERLGDAAAGTEDLEGLADRWAGADPAPQPHVAPTDIFDIIYSSGTTGAPKGIVHDARFRDRQIARLAGQGYGPDAVSLVSTPLYSNTTLAALLPALAHGGTIVMMRKFDERGFLELAERHGVTHAMMVPVQYRRLLDHPDFDRFDLSRFVSKLSTSAPLTPPLIAEVLERWPGKLVNIYGMTEGGVSAVLDCGAFPDKHHTVGRAIPGAELAAIDEAGQMLPAGEVGEIVGRSPTMMTHYRKDPERTGETLWHDAEGRAWIRTGDLGRIDGDGFLQLLDRTKDVIISGGFNVFAVDLEAVLADHPEVAEVAVIGVESDRWGETPLGLVVPVPGARVTEAALMEWANERLGKTQRLTGLRFLDTLPRNAIGKVLKRELRNRFANAARKAEAEAAT